MLKVKYQFIDKNNKNQEILIFSTNNMLKNLNNKNIEQYFMDGTYKIFPNIGSFKSLITLLGYNRKDNTFAQCCYALVTDESENTLQKYLNLLKLNYDFIPKYITIDFSKAEENAIKEVYKNENVEIIYCLFHFVQCLWRKLNSLGLRKKEFIKLSKSLVFNIKILAFIKLEKVEESYNDIKNSNLYKNEKFTPFFKYLDNNWIKKNMLTKWNYFDLISENKNNRFNDDNLDREIFLTNNACETLHSYIKKMISNNASVNVYVFNNIICNLISKNNFDKNNKRKVNNKNKKFCFNLMCNKFSDLLYKIAQIKNKLKVYEYDEMMKLIDEDIHEDECMMFIEE